MIYFNKAFIFLTFLCLVSLVTRAQIISQWRGSDRSGVYPETGLLNEWPKEGPKLLWSSDGLPKGYSSGAVTPNSIFLTGKADTSDVLIALDKKGVVKWIRPYGRCWVNDFSESRCTPTVDGERVYVSSGNGDLACINSLNGKIIWQVRATEKFQGTYGIWGIAESLIVLGNKVFYTPGGNKTTMVALNKMNGETIWMSESIKDNPSYVSPLLIQRGSRTLITTVTEKYVIGVDPEKGKILWKFDFDAYSEPVEKYNINTNTPLYDNGKIYVTSGYNHRSVMLNLSGDATSVSLAWSDSVLDNHHGGVVKIGNYIYGSNWINNRNGKWVCLDWNTGKLKWEKDWQNKGPIISADGFLYIGDENKGNFAIVKASPDNFEIISSFKIPLGSGPFWAHPVIKEGILYIRHGEALMAYDIRKK